MWIKRQQRPVFQITTTTRNATTTTTTIVTATTTTTIAYNDDRKQESRAVVRKPRDAAIILDAKVWQSAWKHPRLVTLLPMTTLWICLHSCFPAGLWKMRGLCSKKMLMAVQRHPKSSISVLTESAYICNFFLMISTLLLFCPISKMVQVFCSGQPSHPYYGRNLKMLPKTRSYMLALIGANTLSLLFM